MGENGVRSPGLFRGDENTRKRVVVYNEGKCKPTTKANKVHDISLGGSDANVRDRDFMVPVNGVHTEARTVHLYRQPLPPGMLPETLCSHAGDAGHEPVAFDSLRWHQN